MMIEHLSTLVENFPSSTNQTRCFTHILNLVAKIILRQCEPKKKARHGEAEDADDAKKALAALTEELNLPDLNLQDSTTQPELGDNPEDLEGLDGDEDLEMDDNDKDGLGDEKRERWYVRGRCG
jgi:hypothetical protein